MIHDQLLWKIQFFQKYSCRIKFCNVCIKMCITVHHDRDLIFHTEFQHLYVIFPCILPNGLIKY